ncbi:peptidoglycan D,D-transpeptidase FtsI family protein [Frateuria aurantia]
MKLRLPASSSTAGRRGRGRAGPQVRRRMALVMGIFVLVALGLVARAFDLQVVSKGFYQAQGDSRFLRVMQIPVSRGTIFDRNGEPLAVSTPVVSIWAIPSEVLAQSERIPELARALQLDPSELKQRLQDHADREFLYLRRQMQPEAAEAVLAMNIPGVNGQREYRRYYPSGEVTAHVLGYTNIDDHGQEGLELAYNDWLAGKAGAERVVRDRQGHVVEELEQVKEPQPGRDLTLSIDRRIQFLAFNELRATVDKTGADFASMVILDVATGEVLAMVNLPTYNPNAKLSSNPSERRNRAATDVFEPGSTMKAFTLAAALSSGKYTPTSPMIDTGNGHFMYLGHDIRDVETGGNGWLTPTGVITKSSNIGAAKIAISLDTMLMYNTYRAFNFGSSTDSGFPGEASGYLKNGATWGQREKAIFAYGYGENVTALQLANGYATIADQGVMHRPSFIKGVDNPGKAIVAPEVAHELVKMLETTTAPGGTATLARIANYSVAAKTGTAHKAQAGGYSKNSYEAVFAGIVPAEHPRLVGVVIVDNPVKGSYYGGVVSGPVFANVMAGALRLLDVPPDNIGRWYVGGPMQSPNGLVGSKPPDDAPAADAPVDDAP